MGIITHILIPLHGLRNRVQGVSYVSKVIQLRKCQTWERNLAFTVVSHATDQAYNLRHVF